MKHEGKKTYILAATMALAAIGMFLAGEIETNVMVQRLVEAGILAALRHGIKTSGVKAKTEFLHRLAEAKSKELL